MLDDDYLYAYCASLKALIKCFPDAQVLMCYFHVIENIRKRKRRIKYSGLNNIFQLLAEKDLKFAHTCWHNVERMSKEAERFKTDFVNKKKKRC